MGILKYLTQKLFCVRTKSLLCFISENLALNKNAVQYLGGKYASFGLGKAETAVDGDRNSILFGKCSITETKSRDSRPWWVVDLGREYSVTNVVITNRGDCCGWFLFLYPIE